MIEDLTRLRSMASLPILLLFVAGALSAPYIKDFEEAVSSEEPTCNDALTRFRRTSISVFNYVGETTNEISGTSTDNTGMRIKATVYIKPLKKCLFSMRIGNSELHIKSKNSPIFSKAAESDKFSKELEAQEVIFRVYEGEVVSIYRSLADSVHVVNIKRGIISAFQLGKTNVVGAVETDVNGVCNVKFEFADGMFTKTKNLSKCTSRANTELGIQSSTIQEIDVPLQPLNSNSRCAYKLDMVGLIVSVECKESHVFRPFSAGYKTTSGAMTNVVQRLVFWKELDDPKFMQSTANAFMDLQEESLLFDFQKEQVKPENTIVDRIDKIMSVLVDKKAEMTVKQDSAHEFAQLVNLLRKLDRKRMTPVWDKYFDCAESRVCQPDNVNLRDVYRQYLLDALTYCGTPTCVYMVHNVIVNEVVSGERMNMFLQGIAFVSQPTKAMIRDIMNIATRVPSRQAYLTLGTLMYRYCSVYPEECVYEKTNPVTQAELFLEDKLGSECEGQEDVDRVEELIRTLKAIGNSGRPSHAWATLVKCARNSIHQNVSIAAIEAMRRMPCNEDRVNELHNLLSDVSVDPERRIHTFLAVIKCPSKESLLEVVRQLENEESRQVGSFMSTHLRNILESADPAHDTIKTNLKEILRGKSLRKIDLELTKYSRAFEGSLHSRWLRTGATSEGHVIFHPESYLPRSVLMNFTANVMGIPLNVLEMAVRLEGLETIIEDVFGPNGILPDNSILKLFNITITKEDFERAERSRNRRDIDNNVLEENIADIHSRVNKRRIQPSGHLSVKMFGHDVRLFTYDDIFWMIDQVDNMNVIELLLNLAKGGQKTFSKSFMFLEMTQSVPVGLGLPLKLKLTGSAVASLELKGKFDIRNMFWGPSQMELKGHIKPSAVAEISGQMGVESRYINTGLLVRSTAFTSQVLKGGIVYKEGQILKVNIDAPEKAVQLFNISTAPYLFLNEEVEMIKGVPRRVSPDFCMRDTIVTGLGLCTSFALPIAFREYEAPYFPLSGPAHYGMKLIKADPKLTTYELKIKKERMEYTAHQKKEYIGSFEMGTPGATYSRRVAGQVKYMETPTTKSLTVGTFEGKKKVEVMVSYNNRTNRFEADFVTDLFTKEKVTAKFLYFNDSSLVNRHIGILVRAMYGDFYKLQQVWKLVKSPTSWKLFSRTTYYPGKHLTGEIEFIPAQRSVNLRFDANQFNQTIDLMGKIVNTPTIKGLNFTAMHLNSKRSGMLFAGFVNEKDAKKLVVKGSLLKKTAEVSVGYYKLDDGYEVKLKAAALGKQIELFTNYSSYVMEKASNEVSEVVFGGRYDGKVVGGRVYYDRVRDGSSKDLCVTTVLNHKEPASLCFTLDSESSAEGVYKRAALTGRILEKRVAVEVEFENEAGAYAFNTSFLYNDKTIAKNSWVLTYNGIWDTELAMITKIGKRDVSVRWYSRPVTETSVVFGVEGKAMNQLVALTATYSMETVKDVNVYGVMFEATVNRKLPLNYSLVLEWGDQVKGIGSILKIFKYTAKSSMMWLRPASDQYSLVLDSSITREKFMIAGFKDTAVLIWGDDMKTYKEDVAVTVWGKEFTCGLKMKYGATYDSEKAKIHELTLGLTYGRGKSITAVTTFKNTEKVVQLTMTTSFLRNRRVTHTILYNKVQRRLNVDIEFLPKMYVRFLAQLDKVQGWKLRTNLKFDWKNMNQALEWIGSYTSTEGLKGAAMEFKALGKLLKVEGMYDQVKKSLDMGVSLFGRSLRIVSSFDASAGQNTIKLVTVNKGVTSVWLQALIVYKNNKASYELRSADRNIFKVEAILKKANGKVTVKTYLLGKELLEISGIYKKVDQEFVLDLFMLGKQRFQFIGKLNKEDKTFFLHFDAMRKHWKLSLAGKYNPAKVSLSLSAEVLGKVVGVVLRADYKKYLMGADVFYNQKMAGWHAYLDTTKKALVYNITLTPRLSAQFVMEIVDDKIAKFTVQRKMGEKIVNETVFKYNLMATESRFIFQWNKDTLMQLKTFMLPLIKEGTKKISLLSGKAAEMTRAVAKLSTDVFADGLKNISSYIYVLTNKLDKSFDEFDFVAARDRLGELLVKVAKRTGALTSKGLLLIRDYSLVFSDNIPVYFERLLVTKDKVVILADKVAVVIQNLTNSARPVLATAIDLAKEFRIRDKTMEEIVQLVIEFIKETTTSVVERVKEEVSEKLPKVTKFVKETRIPYTEKTVEDVYKKVESKVRDSTFNYDIKKTAAWLKKEAMRVEVLEKTIEQHIAEIRKELKKVPRIVKNVIVKTVEMSRDYAEEMKEILEETRVFLLPLTNFMRKVRTSTYKHYSPLVRKAVGIVKGKIANMYKPFKVVTENYIRAVSEFTTPLVRPVPKMVREILRQIGDVRILEKEIGAVLDETFLDVSFILTDWFKYVKETVSSSLYRGKDIVAKMSKMTAEEVVDKVFEMIVETIEEAFKRVPSLPDKQKVKVAVRKILREYYFVKAAELMDRVTQTSFEDVLEMTAKRIAIVTSEVASVASQLANLDLLTPMLTAWKEADVINHLDKFGVNAKVSSIIDSAKQKNLTEVLLVTVKRSKNAAMALYEKAMASFEEYLELLRTIYGYIRDIPKKDFETFYREVESLLESSRAKIWSTLKKNYRNSYEKIEKIYYTSLDNYGKYYKQVVTPATDWLTLIKNATMGVYEDNKLQGEEVFNHYKFIVMEHLKENYAELKKLMLEKYTVWYNYWVSLIKEYEDMILEDIAMLIYKKGVKTYSDTYKKAEMKVAEIRVLFEKVRKLLTKFYRVGDLQMKLYVARFEKEILPKLKKLYVVTYAYMKYGAEEVYARGMEAYENAYKTIAVFYEKNKKLTIEQMYNKAITLTTTTFKDLYKKSAERVQAYYGKVAKLTKDALPELKKELESIFNQTLRASVILANATIENFYPQYMLMKATLNNCIQRAVYYGTGLYETSKAEVKVQLKKLVKLALKLLQSIREHPIYMQYKKEILEHKYVTAAIAQYKETLLRLDGKFQELMRMARELLKHEMVINAKDKISELVKRKEVKRLIEILQLIKESAMYTVEQLKPKIQLLIAKTKETISELSSLASSQITFFRQYPEECVWTSYKKLGAAWKKLRSVDLQTLYENKRNDFISLAIDVTDLRTKETVMDILAKAMELRKRVKMLPVMLKEKYSVLIEKYGKELKATLEMVKEKWELSPIKPIVEHEIWREFLDEIVGHEIVGELSSLVRNAKMIVLDYVKMLREELIVRGKELKKIVVREYKKLTGKVTKFVKETTLEDIVGFTLKTTKRAREMIMETEAKVRALVMKNYAELKLMTDEYVKIVRKEATKYMKEATQMWNTIQPRVASEMQRLTATVQKYKHEIAEWYKRTRTEMELKVKKVWKESGVPQAISLVKKMTLREIIAKVRAFPGLVVKEIKVYKEKALEAIKKYNGVVKQFMMPYIDNIDNALRWIGNEISETAIFITKYYRLREKAMDLKDFVTIRSQLVLPKIPGFVRKVAKDVGKLTLRAFYKGMLYVDAIDFDMAKEYVNRYIETLPDVKGYVTKFVMVDPDEMKLIIKIPHYMPITPSFEHQFKMFNRTARVVANRTIESAKRLIEAIRNRTSELRRDLSKSYAVNEKLAAKAWEVASEYSKDISVKAKEIGSKIIKDSRAKSKEMYEKVKEITGVMYGYAKMAAEDVYASDSLPEAYNTVKQYSTDAVEVARAFIKEQIKEIEVKVKAMLNSLKVRYEDVYKSLKPYYSLLKVAITDLKSGKDFRTSFQNVRSQISKTFRYLVTATYRRYQTIMKSLKIEDPVLRSLVQEYQLVHREILQKYWRRVHRIYMIGKVTLDRAVRVTKTLIGERSKKPVITPYKASAMIFGKEHVLTFDHQYYTVPTYKKKTCTYILARDFHSGNFTVLSQEETIIINTPDMRVDIDKNGQVQTVLKLTKDGYKVEKIVLGLPVQSPTGKCLRDGSFILCSFDQGIEVSCDIDHYACSIQLSGWHYGKTEGLLGSNNNEVYDDFKMPDGVITTSVQEFVDSWEVSGDAECLSKSKENVPVCNRIPSAKCKESFSGKDSFLAPFFKVLNPLSFLKACEVDSASCSNVQPLAVSHCDAAAAYVNALRAMGHRAEYLPECAKHGKHSLGGKWTVAPKREVDIAVLVSQRTTAQLLSKTIASMVFSLNKNLISAGYDTRFALVGFGGSLVHERAHHHTIFGRLFMDEYDITTVIKEMPYGGTQNMSNDAFSAIRLASTLAFRPSAARIVILVNSDSHVPHIYGPTLDETMYALKYEANATLFAFDQLNFKSMGKGKIIGQTTRRAYVVPEYRAISMTSQFPESPMSGLARATDGGLFSNKLKQSRLKPVVTGLTDAILYSLKANTQLCRRCTLYPGNVGQGIPMCRTDNTISC